MLMIMKDVTETKRQESVTAQCDTSSLADDSARRHCGGTVTRRGPIGSLAASWWLLGLFFGTAQSCLGFSYFVSPWKHSRQLIDKTLPSSASRLVMKSAVSTPQHWNDTLTTSNGASKPDASSSTVTTTLGDIMGLVTESEGLAAHYGIHHPLDRMALTANGNLQRLVSSYYDAPVSVVVDYCQARDHQDEESVRIWDRRVSLRIYGQTFCVATSVIRVSDPQCVAWVESGQVGLGQLFRHLNVLPTFTLLRAGCHEGESENQGGGGGFWREYTLSCAQLSCDIHETFVPGLWALKPGINRGLRT